MEFLEIGSGTCGDGTSSGNQNVIMFMGDAVLTDAEVVCEFFILFVIMTVFTFSIVTVIFVSVLVLVG